MTGRLLLAFVALIALASPATAHRLDEYLQAALISIGQHEIVVHLTLTPGVAVAPEVMAAIDTNADGVFSELEQRDYAERVRRDLNLRVDGVASPLKLSSFSFPGIEHLRDGGADIAMAFSAPLPQRARHSLDLETRHQRAIAVYLVNTVLPEDQDIRILGQERNYDQSRYRLDFVVGRTTARVGTASGVPAEWPRDDRLALVRTYFWHGIKHIFTGYDHLLFIAALVLGAATLWDLVKVVTQFTVAHSITLTLAALGLVHLSSGLVEPVIAASIVAVALQNMLSPRQARGDSRLLIAFLFGLFHGLGFASGLLEIMHAMPTSTMLLAIAGFSMGVEAGNQIVLLPLFAVLRTVEHRQMVVVERLRQISSGGILMAGLSYFGIAMSAAI